MVPVPIRDWGDAITTSVAQALSLLLAAVPRIIGFLVIVAIGWFIAALVARAVAALLRSIRFNELSERSGFAGFETSGFLPSGPACSAESACGPPGGGSGGPFTPQPASARAAVKRRIRAARAKAASPEGHSAAHLIRSRRRVIAKFGRRRCQALISRASWRCQRFACDRTFFGEVPP